PRHLEQREVSGAPADGERRLRREVVFLLRPLRLPLRLGGSRAARRLRGMGRHGRARDRRKRPRDRPPPRPPCVRLDAPEERPPGLTLATSVSPSPPPGGRPGSARSLGGQACPVGSAPAPRGNQRGPRSRPPWPV